MDALLLSRIQFGFVISFHVLFPAFTIGTASWLAFVESRWLRTGNPVWRELYFFWQKIFAVSFGMGVVSGIVMAFQFGTNWPRLIQVAGSVIGPLLTGLTHSAQIVPMQSGVNQMLDVACLAAHASAQK